MGSITGKHFQDLLEEDGSELKQKTEEGRTLPTNLDPRSPSSDICRTPIHVDATPKPMVDPRSPTVGIDRTPIFGSKNAFQNIDTTPLRIPASEIAEPDIVDDNGDLVHILQPVFDESQEVEVLERSLSEPDLSTSNEDALLLRQRTAPVSKSFKETVKQKSKKVLYSHTNVSADNSPSKVNGKAAPPRSPLKVISDGSRSPLGVKNVDVNSPRNIVQRKQMTKIAKMKVTSNNKGGKKVRHSPGKYKVFHDDKENSYES